MAYINGKEVLFAPVNSVQEVALQEEKAVEINGNGSVEILPDEGCAAVKKVIANVNVPEKKDSAIPAEISTEAEMTALLESGEVGGVYKYVGTTGTYENGAMYVLEEEAAEDALAGTWILSGNSYGQVKGTINASVNFTSNGSSFSSLKCVWSSPDDKYDYYTVYYDTTDVCSVTKFYAVVSTEYQIIVITSKLAEVSNGSDLLTWLQTYATKQ